MTTLVGCAPVPPQPQEDPIVYRLNQIESRIEKLEQGQQNSRAIDAVSSQQQLQEDMRQLKGQVEQQAFQLQSHEQRLNQLSSQAMSAQTGYASGEPAGQPPLAGDHAQQAQPLDAPAPVPIASPPPVAGEQASYDVAFNFLKEGRYPQATEAFSRFLQQYPSSRLAANAQYWLGESQYVARDYDAALLQFRKVVEQYPGNPKVADALLKIGYIYAEKQQWSDAKSALDRVIREYPQSGAADLARQRLNRLQREGRLPG
ncbi:MAG TPA: tol-pal system protein YbgF [Candidatus Acidoferrales bacterium]|nr:tol-pal system protein YbgF [Candidatus Acidoferrales bacterium]